MTYTLPDMSQTITATATGIEAEVCADIQRRQQLGLQKYGVSVADNPLDLREWLQHAYQECLDQAIYLRRAMSELPPLPKNCQKCGGDGLEEIQSGPYFRKCPACLGAGKEKAPPAKEAADSTP